MPLDFKLDDKTNSVTAMDYVKDGVSNAVYTLEYKRDGTLIDTINFEIKGSRSFSLPGNSSRIVSTVTLPPVKYATFKYRMTGNPRGLHFDRRPWSVAPDDHPIGSPGSIRSTTAFYRIRLEYTDGTNNTFATLGFGGRYNASHIMVDQPLDSGERTFAIPNGKTPKQIVAFVTPVSQFDGGSGTGGFEYLFEGIQ